MHACARVQATCERTDSPHTHLRGVAAQHILFKGGDEDERAAAAEAIKGKIEAGEMTFEAAAQQFSECSSRAQSPAGSLGQFQPGKMVPEFDEYIFNPACARPRLTLHDTRELLEAPQVCNRPRRCRRSLRRSPIGEIAIVDTKFGTHLVKINERNEKWVDGPGKTKTDGGWSF